MRAEEKQLEGPELEREVHKDTQHESEEREQELPQLAGGEVRDLELEHRSRLFDALRLIMDRQILTVSLLGLPQREAQALEALQTAVNGRDIHMNTFVFSEDRKSLLEQALAVLQQNLTYGAASQVAELHGRYDELVAQIGTLREELADLENAQDDLFEEKRQSTVRRDGDEDPPPADDTAPVTDDASITDLVGAALMALAEVRPDPAAPARAEGSTLYEPALPERPPAPSTLSGDPPPAPAPAPAPAKPPLKRRGKRE